MTTTAIVIDDLAHPVLSPPQRAAIDQCEKYPVDLGIDGLLAAAVTRTGLEDFGAVGFRTRLDAQVGAIEADVGMTNLSRLTVRNRMIRLLSSRLLLTDLLSRHPEIHDIEIEKPIIVVGLPRSGTTHLVNLIAADTRRRALPFWESQEPFPLRHEGPDIHGVDPRYRRSVAHHERAGVMTPHLQAMHDRFPAAIEEEVELLDLDFASYVLEWHGRVPDWRDHYLSLDQTVHYSYLLTVLKALTFLRGPRQWVLKSPQHTEQLGPLMATFPDSTVVFTHRDPVSVIQSAITMQAYADRLRRRNVEPEWLADYWTDRIEHMLRACVRDRELVPAERSVDIGFHALAGHELEIMETLYELNGTDLPDEARGNLQRYLADNPRGKHGKLVYDLEGNFHRSADEIRSRFEFYFDRFDVRAEA